MARPNRPITSPVEVSLSDILQEHENMRTRYRPRVIDCIPLVDEKPRTQEENEAVSEVFDRLKEAMTSVTTVKNRTRIKKTLNFPTEEGVYLVEYKLYGYTTYALGIMIMSEDMELQNASMRRYGIISDESYSWYGKSEFYYCEVINKIMKHSDFIKEPEQPRFPNGRVESKPGIRRIKVDDGPEI